jgi:hypothetical protein
MYSTQLKISSVSSQNTCQLSEIGSFNELCDYITRYPNPLFTTELKTSRYRTPYLLIHIPDVGWNGEMLCTSSRHFTIFENTWDKKVEDYFGSIGKTVLGPHTVHETNKYTREHCFYRLSHVLEHPAWMPRNEVEFVLWEVFGIKCKALRAFY